LKEVEHIAKHDGAWIKEYLEGIEKKRGVEARNKLRADVMKIWRK
jgi:hypothetical protein